MNDEYVKRADVMEALKAIAIEQWRLHESYEYIIETLEEVKTKVSSIPSVQVPPKPKDDVIGYRWVLTWDLKELWTRLR